MSDPKRCGRWQGGLNAGSGILIETLILKIIRISCCAPKIAESPERVPDTAGSGPPLAESPPACGKIEKIITETAHDIFFRRCCSKA